MLIVIIIIAVALLALLIMYNSLVGRKNQVENAFAGVDAMLKKRYDLIPNLVNTVKEYMKHEAGTLKEITEMRARAVSGQLSADEAVQLNNKLGRAMRGIMISVENYPDLKASQNFMQLQGSLNEIEEQISASRRAYNAAVTDLNNAIEMFPTNIMASLMGYARRQLFEISDEERQNVSVGELFKG